ncbi:MAG: hypothetical protein Q9178_006788 [Gyalolechia marmorata]
MQHFVSTLFIQLCVWTYTAATLSLPIAAPRITCFRADPDRTRTTVEGCRATLNHLKTIPNWKQPRQFETNKSPVIPATRPGARPIAPPFLFHVVGSDCVLEIDTVIPNAIDRFSFEQARALAQNLLDDCQDFGGFGGFTDLGRGVGWQVTVLGVDLPRPQIASVEDGSALAS